jgi:four helix bundle protein
MATWKEFEDIEGWQKAHDLALAIYDCSDTGRFFKDYGLRDQIRRAAVSVMANIAEGFERGGNSEFARFLSIAKGSAGEVEALLYIAVGRAYINREQFESLRALVRTTKRLVGGLISYLRTSRRRNSKRPNAYHNGTRNPQPVTRNRKMP